MEDTRTILLDCRSIFYLIDGFLEEIRLCKFNGANLYPSDLNTRYQDMTKWFFFIMELADDYGEQLTDPAINFDVFDSQNIMTRLGIPPDFVLSQPHEHIDYQDWNNWYEILTEKIAGLFYAYMCWIIRYLKNSMLFVKPEEVVQYEGFLRYIPLEILSFETVKMVHALRPVTDSILQSFEANKL